MEKDKKKYQNSKIFEYLENILKTKSEDILKNHIEDEEFKSFPSVVIMRYLTMCENKNVRDMIIKNQVFLERLDKVSHKSFYIWCFKNIPKQTTSFIKYIK